MRAKPNTEARPDRCDGIDVVWLEDHSPPSERSAGNRADSIPLVTGVHYLRDGTDDVETLSVVTSRRTARCALRDENLPAGETAWDFPLRLEQTLAKLEQDVLTDVRHAALQSNADAVVDLRLQFGQIDIGGDVVLYVTAQGTPVRVIQAVEFVVGHDGP